MSAAFASWKALYESDAQAVYALWVVPALFLAWLFITPTGRATAGANDPDTRFLRRFAIAFGLETILDPFATGPLLRSLGVQDAPAGTAILLLFVLLGDFRVFLLLQRLSRRARPLGESILRAGLWTLVVPVAAFAVNTALHRAWPELPSQTIWLVYELGFLALALWLRRGGLDAWVDPPDPPRRRALEGIATYAALYYALWALADVLILVLGLDVGWLLRTVPNQLYYAFFLPFAWFQLAGLRSESSSTSTQASR